MPAPIHAERIRAIADLAGPIAAIEAAITIDSTAWSIWLEALGHLRRLYTADIHALLRSALDGYLDGYALPAQAAPATHMLRAAIALLRLAGTADRPPVGPLAEALTSIWATAPHSGPALDTLAAILPPVSP